MKAGERKEGKIGVVGDSCLSQPTIVLFDSTPNFHLASTSTSHCRLPQSHLASLSDRHIPQSRLLQPSQTGGPVCDLDDSISRAIESLLAVRT